MTSTPSRGERTTSEAQRRGVGLATPEDRAPARSRKERSPERHQLNPASTARPSAARSGWVAQWLARFPPPPGECKLRVSAALLLNMAHMAQHWHAQGGVWAQGRPALREHGAWGHSLTASAQRVLRSTVLDAKLITRLLLAAAAGSA